MELRHIVASASGIETARRAALMVLGVHRSGTSAMARVLGLSGGRLPSDPVVANFSNELGFWESEAVKTLNDELLASLDSCWDDVFAGQSRRSLSNFDLGYRKKAAKVIDAVFGGADPIVLKDPRINVVTAFWDAVLQDHGYEPFHVIMVRNPIEVATSLRVRDKLPTEHGLLMWLDHMLAAERDTRQTRRVFIAYEDLLDDWSNCLDRIERAWGKSLPRRTSAATYEIEQYLSPSLRHQQAGEKALQGGSPVREMAAIAFRHLQNACRSEEPFNGAVLDDLRSQLSLLRESTEPVLVGHRARLTDLKSLLAEHAKHSTALEGERARLNEELGAARRDEAALQEERRLLQASAGEQDRALGDARRQAAEGFAEIGLRLEEVRAGQLREAELIETIGKLQGQPNVLELRCGVLSEELRRVQTAAEEAISRSRVLEGEWARTTAELEAARRNEAALQEELGRLQGWAGEQGRELSDLRSQLAEHLTESDRRTEEAGVGRSHEAELSAARTQLGHDLDLVELRYGVLSEELRRVQTAAEEAFSRSRILEDEQTGLKDELGAAGLREAALHEELNLLQASAGEQDRALGDARRQAAEGFAEIGLRLEEVRAGQLREAELIADRDQLQCKLELLEARHGALGAAFQRVQVEADEAISRSRVAEAELAVEAAANSAHVDAMQDWRSERQWMLAQIDKMTATHQQQQLDWKAEQCRNDLELRDACRRSASEREQIEREFHLVLEQKERQHAECESRLSVQLKAWRDVEMEAEPEVVARYPRWLRALAAAGGAVPGLRRRLFSRLTQG